MSAYDFYGNQDENIPAGKGIMPCGDDYTPGTFSKVTGSKGPGQDKWIPAGEGIEPCGDTPFSKK